MLALSVSHSYSWTVLTAVLSRLEYAGAEDNKYSSTAIFLCAINDSTFTLDIVFTITTCYQIVCVCFFFVQQYSRYAPEMY